MKFLALLLLVPLLSACGAEQGTGISLYSEIVKTPSGDVTCIMYNGSAITCNWGDLR